MSLKQALITALEQSYQQQVAFIDTLPADERAATGTPTHWDAKDMMAHITVWQQRLMNELDGLARGEPLPVYGKEDDENAGIFASTHDLDWDAVRHLMAETHARLLAFLRACDETALSDPERSPWADNRIAWTRLAGTGIAHSLMHLASYDIEHGRPQRAIQLADDLPGLMLQEYNNPKGQGITIYNQACLLALAGHAEQAITRLSEALKLNDGLIEWSKEDPDLASLRERADFQALYSG